MNSLLLVHGGPGFDDSYFYPYLDSLKKKFKVASYTQKRAATLDSLCEELKQKIKSNDQPVCVLGHSWGGVLLLETLSRFSDLQTAGIILAATPIDTSSDKNTSRVKTNFESDENFKNACLSLSPIFFGSKFQDEGLRILNKISYSEKSFSLFSQEYFSAFDLKPVLKNIRIPVLNIFGSEDRRVPGSHSISVAILNNKIKNLEIADAGHFMFVEQNQIFCDAVTEFIERATQ